jgi:hypothetical protein
METNWIPLAEQLPEGDECIIMFNPYRILDEDFPGIPIEASNPEYARTNGLKCGYTHWCRVPYPLPRPGGKE